MTAIVLFWAGVAGLMIGSFLNVCISRLPAGGSVVRPRSRCPACGRPIAWFDNVPVISFLALRGRCRQCGASIAWRYLLVEISTAAAFVGEAAMAGDDLVWLVTRLVFIALLIALFWTDIETERLPNGLTIGGIVAGFLFSLWRPPGWEASLVGIMAGAGVLLAIRWLWKRVTGGEGMGLGDVKMLAMIGAFLGWQGVWLVLLLASVAGAVVGLALVGVRSRSMQSRLPFGAFLSGAGLTAALVGDRLISWYLSLFLSP